MYIYDAVNLITPILLVYILMIVVMLGQRYLRIYSRNKMLKFTQEEVKEKKREMMNLARSIAQRNKGDLVQFFNENEEVQYIYEVLKIYNELAVGINEGLYDELYIKMIMGNDMMNFYKMYNKDLTYSMKNDTTFMPLELLLKKWDSNEGPSYKVKNRRRYM